VAPPPPPPPSSPPPPPSPPSRKRKPKVTRAHHHHHPHLRAKYVFLIIYSQLLTMNNQAAQGGPICSVATTSAFCIQTRGAGQHLSQHPPPSPHAISQLVNATGNPWVFSGVPIPAPVLYPSPLQGSGFHGGYTISYPYLYPSRVTPRVLLITYSDI
jgi:hypothetical protein